jgi:CRP-like cAMP-binding protein
MGRERVHEISTEMCSLLDQQSKFLNGTRTLNAISAEEIRFVGMPVVAGFRSSACKVVTQAQGTVFRIKAEDLRTILPNCPQLVASFTRYAQEATMEVTQIAACNRLHEMEERLARWLLMSQDRIRKDVLPLTQEFLSQMLGTRRASVTVAAAILQRAGMIKYSRGQVTILDREALKTSSCECYGIIRKQLENWQKES